MVFIVSQKTTKEEVDSLLSKPKAGRKRINLDKYCGKVNFGMDGLKYQKKVRNEWR